MLVLPGLRVVAQIHVFGMNIVYVSHEHEHRAEYDEFKSRDSKDRRDQGVFVM